MVEVKNAKWEWPGRITAAEKRDDVRSVWLPEPPAGHTAQTWMLRRGHGRGRGRGRGQSGGRSRVQGRVRGRGQGPGRGRGRARGAAAVGVDDTDSDSDLDDDFDMESGDETLNDFLDEEVPQSYAARLLQLMRQSGMG